MMTSASNASTPTTPVRNNVPSYWNVFSGMVVGVGVLCFFVALCVWMYSFWDPSVTNMASTVFMGGSFFVVVGVVFYVLGWLIRGIVNLLAYFAHVVFETSVAIAEQPENLTPILGRNSGTDPGKFQKIPGRIAVRLPGLTDAQIKYVRKHLFTDLTDSEYLWNILIGNDGDSSVDEALPDDQVDQAQTDFASGWSTPVASGIQHPVSGLTQEALNSPSALRHVQRDEPTGETVSEIAARCSTVGLDHEIGDDGDLNDPDVHEGILGSNTSQLWDQAVEKTTENAAKGPNNFVSIDSLFEDGTEPKPTAAPAPKSKKGSWAEF